MGDVAAQGRLARIQQWFSRAASAYGHERHTLAFIVKSTLAATASWVIAHDVLATQSPAFAPFAAVLIMQTTVYQSLLQGLRSIGAVTVGVAVQAAFGYLLGGNWLTFALATLAALTIGRWGRLGSQGSQVTTAAFFAFSTYVAATGEVTRLMHLGQIILLVLVGVGVGIVVNVVLFPPIRYRSAEHGIHALANSLAELLRDIAPALREEGLEEERTAHWRHRAHDFAALVRQAKAAVHTAQESFYLNPRRLLHRHRGSFSSYESVVDALERVAFQVDSLTRSFHQWRDGDDDTEYEVFLREYGEFVAAIGRITELCGELDEDRLSEQAPELCSAADDATELHGRLKHTADRCGLPTSDPTQPYGILLAEAARLLEDCRHTCDVLQHSVA